MSAPRLTILALAATAIAGPAAHAADLSLPPLPAPVVEEYSGWYLRGDVGMSNQRVGSLFNVLYAGNSVTPVGMGFDSAPFFGLGVGYAYNNWLRFDVTGEYRGRSNFHGTDIVGPFCTTPSGFCTDEYRASKSEWLFLANAYVDLGTWYSLTPFVGAGVGTSRNTISSFVDTNTPTGTVAFGDSHSKWQFAWALHAGLAYKLTRNATVEFAYRYVNLGDAASGDLYTFTGFNGVNNPMEFRRLTSHDFKLGLRMNLDAFMPASTRRRRRRCAAAADRDNENFRGRRKKSGGRLLFVREKPMR
jgi:opacity protein-like surface antigen